MYLNVNNPVNYQLQGFGQNGVRTISTDQLYIQGEYYRVLVAEEDSYVTAVSVLGDDLTAEFVYAGTTIYGLFTEVSVSSGSLTAYIAGPTDIEDVWAYINAYGQTNAATIEAANCAKDAIAPLLDKYYAKASLVMVPSLYKTSIVYSERPLTTSGQLAFTRSNDTATRVNSAGLIEKVRTNLALYSEEFSNAYWTKTTTTITDNTAANPINGATTADTLTRTGGLSGFIRRQIAQTGVVTFSVFAKSGSTNLVRLNVYDGSTDRGATYNLTTGAITTIYGSPLLTLAQDLGGGWYRISISVNSASYSDCQVHLDSANSVIIFGAQLETGDIATAYIPTTTAAVSVGPVANLPRLNYPINSDGSVGCPSLLLEPQRQNIFPKSESSDTWSFTNMTRTANHGIAPDGYQSADLLAPTTTGAVSLTSDSTTSSLTIGQPFVSSFFIKLNQSFTSNIGLNTLQFRLGNSALWSRPIIRINLETGVVTNDGGASYVSSTNYGNGWFRITFGATPTGTSGATQLQFPTGATMDGGSFYIWGLQGEANATYATSYIPTLAAAVTRGADACSKTGISSLTSASEYTIYWEGTHIPTGEYNSFATFYNNANTSNSARFYRNNTDNQIRASVLNSATGLILDLPSGVTTQTAKCAIRVKAGDYALYVNGALVNSSTNALAPASNLDAVNLQYFNSSQSFDQKTGQVLFFKTGLTNQELQDLTTL